MQTWHKVRGWLWCLVEACVIVVIIAWLCMFLAHMHMLDDSYVPSESLIALAPLAMIAAVSVCYRI